MTSLASETDRLDPMQLVSHQWVSRGLVPVNSAVACIVGA